MKQERKMFRRKRRLGFLSSSKDWREEETCRCRPVGRISELLLRNILGLI